MMDLRRVLPLIAALACGVPACATPSTTIEQSWRGTVAANAAPRNIAIVYMSQDGAVRRTAEDKLAAQLGARGIHAVPSYHVLGDDEMVENQRKAAKGKLAAAGFDGVITMR